MLEGGWYVVMTLALLAASAHASQRGSSSSTQGGTTYTRLQQIDWPLLCEQQTWFP